MTHVQATVAKGCLLSPEQLITVSLVPRWTKRRALCAVLKYRALPWSPMSALGQKQTCAVQLGMSALPPKADMCSATRDVPFGPEADITELGCHQRLDFTSLIAGPVAPLPFHRSPLSSSKPKQLGWRSSVAADIGGLRFNTTATSVFHIEWWGTLVPSTTFVISSFP